MAAIACVGRRRGNADEPAAGVTREVGTASRCRTDQRRAGDGPHRPRSPRRSWANPTPTTTRQLAACPEKTTALTECAERGSRRYEYRHRAGERELDDRENDSVEPVVLQDNGDHWRPSLSARAARCGVTPGRRPVRLSPIRTEASSRGFGSAGVISLRCRPASHAATVRNPRGLG
jgi:hypothetical protein